MITGFKLAKSFDKVAAAAAVPTTAAAPATVAQPVSRGFGDTLRSGWQNLSPHARNAILSALAGGVVSKLTRDEFLPGAMLGAGLGFGGSHMGILPSEPDLATQGLTALGLDPMRGYAPATTNVAQLQAAADAGLAARGAAPQAQAQQAQQAQAPQAPQAPQAQAQQAPRAAQAAPAAQASQTAQPAQSAPAQTVNRPTPTAQPAASTSAAQVATRDPSPEAVFQGRLAANATPASQIARETDTFDPPTVGSGAFKMTPAELEARRAEQARVALNQAARAKNTAAMNQLALQNEVRARRAPPEDLEYYPSGMFPKAAALRKLARIARVFGR